LVVWLVEEIILIVCRCKVILSPGLASERFTVADLLKIIQTAGDTLVAVAVEGVQVDAGSAVNAGADFGAFQDRLSVCIHDAGSSCAVGVDEVGVLACLIIRSFQIAITKRCLDSGEGRNYLLRIA
jgi:sulfur carrier protein ThiS